MLIKVLPTLLNYIYLELKLIGEFYCELYVFTPKQIHRFIIPQTVYNS